MEPSPKLRPEEFEGELSLEVRHVDDADLQRVLVDVRGLAVQQHRVPTVEPFHPHLFTDDDANVGLYNHSG